jgi:glycosyltransferase involved in cell wall biosynthesis
MRILMLINRVPWPLTDGGSVMYYQYIKGYVEAGCEVTVAALNTTKHYVDPIPHELSSIAKVHTTKVDNRVKPIPAFLNLFSDKSYHVERFISAGFEAMLKGLLQNNTYDVISCETIFMAPYLNVIRNNSKALLVLRQHNVEFMIWETLARGETNPLRKWYLSLLAKRLKQYEQKILKSFDALTVVTANDKRHFEEMGYTGGIHIGPLGLSVIKSDRQPQPASLFHIGSMEWEPNKEAIRWFVRQVWPIIREEYPQASFHLAGRKLTDDIGLSGIDGVALHGEVPDVWHFMQEYRIMVVPLFSGSGIRVKILEGMAAGKAVITTSLGAQGIGYEDGKNILIADTANEFCHHIGQLINNPLLCNTIGNEAQKLIEKEYGTSKVITEMLRFYQEQINLKQ